VPKLDRLARSVPDARAIGDDLAGRGIKLSLGGKQPKLSARQQRELARMAPAVRTAPRRCAIVNGKQQGRSATTGTEGRGLVAVKDRAQENGEYVRTPLKKKQPEFAALLDRLDWELRCLSGRETMCAEPATAGCS
jgi:hypothetical protein